MNHYEHFTLDELHNERTNLEGEKNKLEKFWMVPDDDDEWNEVARDLDLVNRAIKKAGSNEQKE